jgi:hypothetical protein
MLRRNRVTKLDCEGLFWIDSILRNCKERIFEFSDVHARSIIEFVALNQFIISEAMLVRLSITLKLGV